MIATERISLIRGWVEFYLFLKINAQYGEKKNKNTERAWTPHGYTHTFNALLAIVLYKKIFTNSNYYQYNTCNNVPYVIW